MSRPTFLRLSHARQWLGQVETLSSRIVGAKTALKDSQQQRPPSKHIEMLFYFLSQFNFFHFVAFRLFARRDVFKRGFTFFSALTETVINEIVIQS